MRLKTQDQITRLCDDVLNGCETQTEARSRRVWLQNFAAVSATATVLWACGDTKKDKATADTGDSYTADEKKSDAKTMNVALELEHEAIAIYTAAAGLAVWDANASALAPTFLDVAKLFLAHHTAHKGMLIEQIEDIKGDTDIEPVLTKEASEYLAAYPGIAGLSGASGLLTVLQVAAEREMNAANAYFGVIASFKNTKLMQTLGGLSADEAAHYGVLNAAALAHDALAGLNASELTATNLVSGSLPPFTYPRTVRTA